jgi:hypothetical protein
LVGFLLIQYLYDLFGDGGKKTKPTYIFFDLKINYHIIMFETFFTILWHFVCEIGALKSYYLFEKENAMSPWK